VKRRDKELSDVLINAIGNEKQEGIWKWCRHLPRSDNRRILRLVAGKHINSEIFSRDSPRAPS